MLPLMEMMMQAGGGQSLDRFASQFGMSREQTEKAMEALMPAFSEGLKRNMADPTGFARFMGALYGGHHASYFDQPETAFSESGIAEGNAILGHLFGSKELSRAVAAQAAQMSGLSQTIMKQMLPMLAPMVLGGLFKQMSGQGPAQAGASAANPFGPILEQMMGGGRTSPDASPAGNPWTDMLEQMMGGGAATKRQSPAGGNPWTDMLEQMMGGARTGGRSETAASDNPLGQIFEEMLRSGSGTRERVDRSPPSGTAERSRRGGGQQGDGQLGDLFGEMFEAGRKTQRDYQRGMESIFDSFIDGMTKR